ncbi:MAG: DUF131 domain-containing protein [Nitrososphaerota archaeon]
MEESPKQAPAPLNAFILLTVGIVLVFFAIFLIIVSTTWSTDVKGGALFLIGPLPLVLTFDKPTFWLAILLPILFILVPLLLFLTWLRRAT